MVILNPTISLNSLLRSNSVFVESLGLFKKQVITLSENNNSFVVFFTSYFFFLFYWVIKNSNRLLIFIVFWGIFFLFLTLMGRQLMFHH